MICEAYTVVGDAEKSYLGSYEFRLVPVAGDQVQIAEVIYVVAARRVHNLDGEFRGAVELYLKGAE